VRLIGALVAVVAGVMAIGAAAIAVVGGTRTPPPTPAPAPVREVRAVESQSPVHAADGSVWTPDRFAHGGSLLSGQVAIPHTASPALYRGQRVGVSSIDVPLRASGNYLVVLYFAEIAGAAPGGRVFEVEAQQHRIATVDVAGEVGALAPYHLAFTVAVPRRTLTIRFRALHGQPILNALRVAPASATLQLPARRQVWSDEFDGPAGQPPDPTRWRYDLGDGWGQRARYTSSPDNAALDGHGDLVLAARPEGESGTAGTAGAATGGSATAAGRLAGAHPTSARLTTRGLFAMRFGTASARVRVAGDPGVVSTFWALGDDLASVPWPHAGEFDPMEVRGVQPRVLVQALHMPCAHPLCPIVWERATPGSLAGGFHTFTIQRAPGVVTYLVDGHQTASLTSADVPRGAWVFDKRFFLILNLIVGGWGGSPTAATHWPATMLVDWVRVWE
jgi:beta-glucanase (GH16 family)